ncbi:hypothetical protein BDV06DRAFT_227938 [Aspergillus oleicola]
MKLLTTISLLAAAVPPTVSSRPNKNARQAIGSGSGPYPAVYTTSPALTNHTIYAPTTPFDTASPLLVWGNGGCSANGTRFANFLTNIASYGYIVIANGPPNGDGDTTAQMMTDAIDWAEGQTSSSTESIYSDIDLGAIAVAGQSCGGLETYQMRDDERVRFLGIFNSGFIADGSFSGLPDDGPMLEAPETISEVHKPVFYFLGGPTDVAYPNGEKDYAALEGVPKWIGNYPVGHSGTYQEVDGGAFGVAAVHWLEWVFKGDEAAVAFFTEGGAERAGWNETKSEGLDRLGEY